MSPESPPSAEHHRLIAVSRFALPEEDPAGFAALVEALKASRIAIEGQSKDERIDEGKAGGGKGDRALQSSTKVCSSNAAFSCSASFETEVDSGGIVPPNVSLEASLWASPLAPSDVARLTPVAARLCRRKAAASSTARVASDPILRVSRARLLPLSFFVERSNVAFGGALRLAEAAARPARAGRHVSSAGSSSDPSVPSAHVLVFDLSPPKGNGTLKTREETTLGTALSWCALDATEIAQEPTIIAFGVPEGRNPGKVGAKAAQKRAPGRSLIDAIAAAAGHVQTLQSVDAVGDNEVQAIPRQHLLDRTLASCAPMLLPWGAVLLKQSAGMLRERRRAASTRP